MGMWNRALISFLLLLSGAGFTAAAFLAYMWDGVTVLAIPICLGLGHIYAGDAMYHLQEVT